MKKQYILAFFVIFSTLMQIAAQNTFSDNDLKGILYMVSSSTGSYTGNGNFLVLDSISLDCRELVCHIYGTNRKVTVKPAQVRRSCFYEDSSSFMITQYAFYGFARNLKSNPALELARICGDTSGRMAKFTEYEKALSDFSIQLQMLNNQYHRLADKEDILDALFELLDSVTLEHIIRQTAAARDWVLAIAMYERYQQMIYNAMIRPFNHTHLAAEASEKLRQCERDLLELFANQHLQANARKEMFQKFYPRARGLWSRTPPQSYAQLRNYFEQSMQAYFKLDELSQLTEPQDWGSTMLDTLLLIEGSPGAAELEKEFDLAMRKLTQSHSRSNSGAENI